MRFLKCPAIYSVDSLFIRHDSWPKTRLEDGRWVPMRVSPLKNSILMRLLAAWLVLIGRADAIRWTEQ
jgi:hypothetical protein